MQFLIHIFNWLTPIHIQLKYTFWDFGIQKVVSISLLNSKISYDFKQKIDVFKERKLLTWTLLNYIYPLKKCTHNRFNILDAREYSREKTFTINIWRPRISQ